MSIIVRNNYNNLRTRSVTETDTPTYSDELLILSGASFTVTLPSAVGNAGKVFELIHNGTSLTQVYTLNTTSAQTIGGIASGSYALYTNGERLKIVSNGTNWLILDHFAQTQWTSYAATTAGFGSITSSIFVWKRSGSVFLLEGSFTTGTPTATGATVAFPSNVVSASDYVGTEVCDVAGTAANGAPLVSLIDASVSTVWFGYAAAGISNMTKQNGNSIANSSARFSVRAKVRITGWKD